jgi:hypothetical protein
MVFDVDPDELIKEIGHDGQEIWWPEYNDARKYRGHSMQEIIDCGIRRKIGLIPIDAMPMQAPTGALPRLTYADCQDRFIGYIDGCYAIIVGQLLGSEVGHACAWDGSKLYDPNGVMNGLSDLSIRTAWLPLFY